MAEKSNAEIVKENRAYIEQNRYEYPNCPHPAVDKLEDACGRLEQQQTCIRESVELLKEATRQYLPQCDIAPAYFLHPIIVKDCIEQAIAKAEEILKPGE